VWPCARTHEHEHEHEHATGLLHALTDAHRLINLATSPGVKYKQSNMPFVQMENISHFLRACELPPLNLPAHDRFLTVDLYEQKDPTQVLQCIVAFSRRANAVKPSVFRRTLGAQSKGGAMSPASTGSGQGYPTPPPAFPTRARGESNSSEGNPTTWNPLAKGSYTSGRISPTKPSSLSRGGLATGGAVSSWSNKDDEIKSAPAWNIHQYGVRLSPSCRIDIRSQLTQGNSTWAEPMQATKA
jgi:hypothetical protein